MWLIRGIEMRACRTCVGCAAIAKFMYMKAVLSGSQARELCVNLHAIGARSKRNGAADFIAAVACSTEIPFDDAADFGAGVCAKANKPANEASTSPINEARSEFILASVFRSRV
jgi:hypothetical protein